MKKENQTSGNPDQKKKKKKDLKKDANATEKLRIRAGNRPQVIRQYLGIDC